MLGAVKVKVIYQLFGKALTYCLKGEMHIYITDLTH